MTTNNPDARDRAEVLEESGRNCIATGKGYAIGSATLVSLTLFGAYVAEAAHNWTEVSTTNIYISEKNADMTHFLKDGDVNVLKPLVFSGMIVGAMVPYVFSAMLLRAVG